MSNSFLEWLKKQIEARGWSNNEFGRRAGVSSSLVSYVLAGQRSVTADFCISAAEALGMDPVRVLRLAGHLPPTVEDQAEADPVFRELLYLYRELPPGDRAAALRMVRGLASDAPVKVEATRAEEVEQRFYMSRDHRVRDLPEAEQRVYVDLLKAIARLASPAQLEWAAEWFRQAGELEEGE